MLILHRYKRQKMSDHNVLTIFIGQADNIKRLFLCRGRSDLSWKVERSGGDILNLDSQARKLRITLSEATTGVYHCYSAGRLVHSFAVRMTGGSGKAPTVE